MLSPLFALAQLVAAVPPLPKLCRLPPNSAARPSHYPNTEYTCLTPQDHSIVAIVSIAINAIAIVAVATCPRRRPFGEQARNLTKERGQEQYGKGCQAEPVHWAVS